MLCHRPHHRDGARLDTFPDALHVIDRRGGQDRMPWPPTTRVALPGPAPLAGGRPTKVPPRPFTALAALLNLRGPYPTLVLDLAPMDVAPLAQEITLVPVILGPREAPQEDRLVQPILCTVARL